MQFSRLQSCKLMSASCDFAVCVHPILKYLQTLQSIRPLALIYLFGFLFNFFVLDI